MFEENRNYTIKRYLLITSSMINQNNLYICFAISYKPLFELNIKLKYYKLIIFSKLFYLNVTNYSIKNRPTFIVNKVKIIFNNLIKLNI